MSNITKILHKYYINQDKEEEISEQEATESWFKNVYTPVIIAIEKHKILKNFKGRTKSDLYVFLIKYWDELKQKFGNDFSLDKAAYDFKKMNQKKSLVKIIKNLKAKLHIKKMSKNSN
jgi:hypothetical protein